MFADIQQKVRQLATENASAILTATGVVGTVGTAILTGRASFKAAEIIKSEREHAAAIFKEEHEDADMQNWDVTRTQKVLWVWPQFIPPVTVGTATIASIIMANRISAQKAAALAAAYGISESRLKEYKEKVSEKLTGPKNQAIKDEIAQDQVNANPPNKEVIIIAGGDVLCYDMLTGRYFQSTVEKIRSAENMINQALYNHQYASLSEFYENVGLPPTSFTDEVGWNMALLDRGALSVDFSTTTTPDNQPCLTVDFNNPPRPDYTQLY